jgi:hypothetical protein
MPSYPLRAPPAFDNHAADFLRSRFHAVSDGTVLERRAKASHAEGLQLHGVTVTSMRTEIPAGAFGGRLGTSTHARVLSADFTLLLTVLTA